MKAFAAILALTVPLLSGCRTQPWICGNALFENALLEEEAQISPYVFCTEDEADLVLTIALRFPDEHRRRPVRFFFRAKRPDERLVLRARQEQVTRAGFLWSRSTDYVAVVIRGEDLWVSLITQRGMRSLGSATLFGASFKATEPGFVLEGAWAKKHAQPVATANALTELGRFCRTRIRDTYGSGGLPLQTVTHHWPGAGRPRPTTAACAKCRVAVRAIRRGRAGGR